ncbi:MAG TPA: translation elongation factor Ts [Bacilli bacterium]|nr:translation elongation factor Ts [Bacilli bacterium]
MISASLVKELRDKTGAGMMDCKAALVATNGDIEQAVDWLREKGIVKAAKKADRIAAEGLCSIAVSGNTCFIYELNSETDFVAKNDMFLELLNKVGEFAVAANVTTVEELLAFELNGTTLEKLIADATFKIGEKLSLRRVLKIVKSDTQNFGIYKHMGGKIATVTVVEGANEEVAKDVAMHVAAMNPKYLDRNSVSPEVIEHEKHIFTQEALAEGKPIAIVEKMVVGRVQKYLKEICLVDQPFVKNPDVIVADYVKSNKGAISSFVRFEVGEGMEKKVDDFVAEVMAAVNSK